MTELRAVPLPEVEYTLRIADTEYARRIGMVGGLCWKMTLPEGTEIEWDPPVAGGQLPDGLPDVELLADDVLVARGRWPNLQAVDA